MSAKPDSSLPRPSLLKTSLGLTMASLALPQGAQAAESVELGATAIKGEQDGDYQTRRMASEKYTQPLRDVPQSISVVPRELIEQQNAQTLEDVLNTVAGITFNSGEGAGGVGDTINIRGFNTGTYGGSNVFIDGVRDSAYYTRSEMFNVEQVEVIKGSSSSTWGAGVIGGAVNMVSKTPRLEDFNKVTGGVGTAEYKRLTLDTNHVLDADRGAAFRLNLVKHESGINGRDWIDRERWGIAPSLGLGLGTDTRFILGYEHLEDTGNYDYGIPTVHDGKSPRLNGGSVSRYPGVKWDSYWGYRNLDKEDNRIDRLKLKFEHDFNDNLRIDNQFTWSRLVRDYVVTTPEGSCLFPTGTVVGANGTCNLSATSARSDGTGRRLIGPSRHTENQILSNQTNLIFNFDTAGIHHDLVTGIELSKEKLSQKNGSLRYGTLASRFAVDPSDPPSKFSGSTENAYTSRNDAESETKAYYVIDTLKFSPQWQADVSARRDHWEAQTTKSLSRTIGTNGVLSDWANAAGYFDPAKEILTSYRAALTYKPAENGSIYISYSTGEQPGAIGATAAGGVSETDAELTPTKGRNYELGTKWDLVDGRLSLTGALFRTESTGPVEIDATTGDKANLKYRVDGVELGASGNITDAWSMFATYSYLDSVILEDERGYSDTRFDRPGGSQKGIEMSNVPKHAASIWTSYRLNDRWSLDYGVRYVGEKYIGLGQQGGNVTKAQRAEVPAYVVHNAAVKWQTTDELGLRLNLVNLFDKHYFRQYNGRGFGVPGEGRGAQLTAEYSF